MTLLNAIYPLSTDAVPRYVCIHPLCTSIQSQTDYTPIHRDHVEMEYGTRPVHHWHFKNCCKSEYCQWIDPTAQHMNTQLGGTIKSGTKSEYDCQSQVFSPGDRCLLSWCLRGRATTYETHPWANLKCPFCAESRQLTFLSLIFSGPSCKKQTPGGKILKSSNMAFPSCIFF